MCQLISLLIQECQIFTQAENERRSSVQVRGMIAAPILTITVISPIISVPSEIYILFGAMESVIYILIYIPQIWQNYETKSAAGHSLLFLLFSLIGSGCDLVSAICLDWPWPSLISPPLMVVAILILSWQKVAYDRMRNHDLHITTALNSDVSVDHVDKHGI